MRRFVLAWFKPIEGSLMIVAFLLVVIGVTTPNPTAVGGEKLLMADAPVQGIQRITRHPFLWRIVVWAVTHLIANGDMAFWVFFGSFAIVALIGMPSIDVKRKKPVVSNGNGMPTQPQSFHSLLSRRAKICW